MITRNFTSLSAIILALFLAVQTWTWPATAQVADSERAAARQLFREGDELQRAGKVEEALDKFERAEHAYAAPTNVLRIAECQAALGRLVASAESYRSLLRAPLPPDAPAVFRAALEQAKGELGQVEPRIPKLRISPEPANVAGATLRIDSQPVSSALIGEQIPLDPGQHRIDVSAPGYLPSNATATLREHDENTLRIALLTAATASPSVGDGRTSAAPGPAASSQRVPSSPSPITPPTASPPQDSPRSNRSVLLGVHLGATIPAGYIPTAKVFNGSSDVSNVSSGGADVGLDFGYRFARRLYVGALVEHAFLNSGPHVQNYDANYVSATSNTSLVELVIGFIQDPDRVSFFGEVGIGCRWYTLDVTPDRAHKSLGVIDETDSGPELTLGGGLWIPAGRKLRLLPEASLGLGTFQQGPGQSTTPAHAFFMLGLAGFFNAELP
jgi:hypothetical protein